MPREGDMLPELPAEEVEDLATPSSVASARAAPPAGSPTRAAREEEEASAPTSRPRPEDLLLLATPTREASASAETAAAIRTRTAALTRAAAGTALAGRTARADGLAEEAEEVTPRDRPATSESATPSRRASVTAAPAADSLTMEVTQTLSLSFFSPRTYIT